MSKEYENSSPDYEGLPDLDKFFGCPDEEVYKSERGTLKVKDIDSKVRDMLDNSWDVGGHLSNPRKRFTT